MAINTCVHVEPGEHAVEFFGSDLDLVATVGGYLGDGLRLGDVVVAVATPAHCQAVADVISAAGVDVAQARASGRLVEVDAAAALAKFSVGGRPDPARFDVVVGNTLRRAVQSGRPVRAFGEMVALLWEAGQLLGVLELEKLWNDLGTRLPFSLLCAYPSTVVEAGEAPEVLAEVCTAHGHVSGAAPTDSDAEWTARFPRSPDAPGSARRFVTDVLQTCERSELVEDARLVVTELATNAVSHARSDFTVSCRWMYPGVRITVGDSSRALPVRAVGHSTKPGGRGLALIEAVSADWGNVPRPIGKLVWAELAAPAG